MEDLRSLLEEAIKAIEERDKAGQEKEEELYKKYGCRRWLIAPPSAYEGLLKDESIKKRDIEKDSYSAFIRTIENLGAYQWVRIYKQRPVKFRNE